MAAHQAPPSLGFSRQEHWSGLPFPSPMCESEKWKWSHSVMSNSLQPARLLCPWDFLSKSTGAGCHCLLQKNSVSDYIRIMTSPNSFLDRASQRSKCEGKALGCQTVTSKRPEVRLCCLAIRPVLLTNALPTGNSLTGKGTWQEAAWRTWGVALRRWSPCLQSDWSC